MRFSFYSFAGWRRLVLLALLMMGTTSSTEIAWASKSTHHHHKHSKTSTTTHKSATPSRMLTQPAGQAEAQLLQIYELMSQAHQRQALSLAEKLVHEYPNFQLGQLVYGDLLTNFSKPVQKIGDVVMTLSPQNLDRLHDLREESRMRIQGGVIAMPPAGYIPAPLLALSSQNHYAIVVDTTRSRLYLFENTAAGPVLRHDFYVTIGKLGTGKQMEGDQRTPLGVYYITSRLNPKNLKDFYGAGALPINYPNPYDAQYGKTGGGIWLHGTPSNQYARPPKASDGCVVLANPDLQQILALVKTGSTPVIIAQDLQWISPSQAQMQAQDFVQLIHSFTQTKTQGNLAATLAFYDSHFAGTRQDSTQWKKDIAEEVQQSRGHSLNIKDISILHWKGRDDVAVVTYGEVPEGERKGVTRHQYWWKRSKHWTIFSEGIIR